VERQWPWELGCAQARPPKEHYIDQSHRRRTRRHRTAPRNRTGSRQRAARPTRSAGYAEYDGTCPKRKKENTGRLKEDVPSRIQLAPHARRRAVPETVSEWVPAVRLTSDEVAKSGRTGITRAYTQDMLSRERTMDCIMHYRLGDYTIY